MLLGLYHWNSWTARGEVAKGWVKAVEGMGKPDPKRILFVLRFVWEWFLNVFLNIFFVLPCFKRMTRRCF